MKKIITILLAIIITFTSALATNKAGYQSFVATAYSLRGKTASGKQTRNGIIAADPRVLPLGTRVHIEGHGTFVVADTGGKIKGNRIDIWMSSNAQAIQFGKRKVKLRVL